MSAPMPTHSISIPPAMLLTLTSRFAFSAAIIVVGMFSIFAITGIGQDPLQYIHSPNDYAAIAQQNPPVLRFAIGLDNLFIVLYSSMFLALGAWLWQRGASKPFVAVALGLQGVTAVLDLIENMHFLTVITAALQGIGISQREIDLQVLESMVKFHVSYLGLFLLSFVLPQRTLIEKALAFSLRWVQLPIGLLIYLVPAAIAAPLVMVRFTFFLFALLAIAVASRRREFGSGEPA